MNINEFAANSMKTFLRLSFPMKIVVSVAVIVVILIAVSRFNWWRYQQKIKANITPHKQTVDITKVPSEVKSFLSDENLQTMDENGMNIYTGNNPPNIEGTYVFKNIIIKYDPQGTNFGIVPYYYRFSDQKDNTVILSSESKEGKGKDEDLAEGKGVFISGEDNCFSVYLDNSGNVGQCQYKTAEIFSACKEERGLVDMDQGTLWTYIGDQCSSEKIVTRGHLRIFSQKSLAPNE